jgi:hypothetical protein
MAAQAAPVLNQSIIIIKSMYRIKSRIFFVFIVDISSYSTRQLAGPLDGSQHGPIAQPQAE